MLSRSEVCLTMAALALYPAWAMADATPVRSSVDTFVELELTNVDQSDDSDNSESQSGTLKSLGPVISTATIDSSQGFYTGTADGIANFIDADRGTINFDQSYMGSRGHGNVQAERFSHELGSVFQYDFTVSFDGTINISGIMNNSGPSSISYFGFIEVAHESKVGGGFEDAFFQHQVFDFTFTGAPFNLNIPLQADSGSYRVRMRLGHIGIGVLDSPLSEGSFSASWDIQAENPCPADTNMDGTLNFLDVTEFLILYGNNDPMADFTGDGTINFFDVSQFLAVFFQGCP